MKRIEQIAIAAIVAAATLSSFTVNRPAFKIGTFKFAIASVEVSDTATRVNSEVYNLPGYWVSADTNFCLQGAVTKKSYPLVRIEGMPLREKLMLPDSAYTTATFVFPPLDAADTVVDFVEKGGAWYVLGVQLGKRPADIVTEVSGTLNGHPESSWLILIPSDTDPRANKTELVPVRNGKFSYALHTADTLKYDIFPGNELIKGGWTYKQFFTDGQPVTIDMTPSDDHTIGNKMTAGELTRKIIEYKDSLGRAYENSHVRELYDSLPSAQALHRGGVRPARKTQQCRRSACRAARFANRYAD